MISKVITVIVILAALVGSVALFLWLMESAERRQKERDEKELRARLETQDSKVLIESVTSWNLYPANERKMAEAILRERNIDPFDPCQDFLPPTMR